VHERETPHTAANEGMSSAKGDEANELIVVEIKKFVWRKLTSRRKDTIPTSYNNKVLLTI